jgi:cytochrome c
MQRRQVLAVPLLFLMKNALAEGLTRKDAEALTRKAEAFFKANGREKLLAALSQKDGEFHKGELYVFAYDMTATVLAHPINPKLIGRNTFDQPDPDGKLYRREIVELAKTKGNGWVDYKYKNPVSNKVEDKTSFVLTVGDLILVAGVYKD